MNKPLILVVEDDAPVRSLITTTLRAHDYRFSLRPTGNPLFWKPVRTIRTSCCWIWDCRIWMA